MFGIALPPPARGAAQAECSRGVALFGVLWQVPNEAAPNFWGEGEAEVS